MIIHVDHAEERVARMLAEGIKIPFPCGAHGGSVLHAALHELFDEREGVLLDAKIQPQLIDRVRAGDKADVRFSSFAHSPQLVVNGVVKSISKDAVTETTAMGNVAYYTARVQITAEGLKQLGQHNLQPGMLAEILIKTGERSLLTYLLHPLLKRVAGAMTEE